jgi:hypothetical protein
LKNSFKISLYIIVVSGLLLVSAADFFHNHPAGKYEDSHCPVYTLSQIFTPVEALPYSALIHLGSYEVIKPEKSRQIPLALVFPQNLERAPPLI